MKHTQVKYFAAIVAVIAMLTCTANARADVLANGGPIITHPGGMTGTVAGADRSAISPNVPAASTLGFGGTGTIRLADDFTLTNPSLINSMQFFAYLTGGAAPSATGLTVAIWDGTPGGAGTIIWGDQTTNVLSSTGWMDSPSTLGVFRTSNTDTAGATRRLQQMTTSGHSIFLNPGTYWIDFNYTGVSFTPPVSDPAAFPVGNALQFQVATGWAPLIDGGATLQVAMPFIINGVSIPEPAGLAVLALGMAGFVSARRRK